MKILTALETRAAEKYAEGIGLSAQRLMENAGGAATRIIKEQFAISGKRVVILTGQGNNGGDGFVVARKLKEYGAKVSVVMASALAGTQNSSIMQGRAASRQIPMIYYFDNTNISEELLDSADIIVDAIFGIGFHGALDRDIKTIIERANSSNASRVALDIPSGTICDSGEVLNTAFKADITISFIGYKPCHFTFPAAEYCGKVFGTSIGFDLKDDFKSYGNVLDVLGAKALLSKIPRNAHKGVKGTVGIYAGSYGMAGAAIISARSAMRSGAGLVKLCIPRSIYNIVGGAVPEVVCRPLNDINGFLDGTSVDFEDLKNIDSLLIGPGMGDNEHTKKTLFSILDATNVPMVIDADGLNSITENLDILKESLGEIIITPHPKEMARLLKTDVAYVEKNRVEVAKNFSKQYGVITVLKGAYTVIASPKGECFINTTGCQGMATAGSGDMLTGMIAAFLANGCSPLSATVSAVCLHGEAGEKTAERLGIRGMLVTDMIEQLPFILN